MTMMVITPRLAITLAIVGRRNEIACREDHGPHHTRDHPIMGVIRPMTTLRDFLFFYEAIMPLITAMMGL